MAAPMNEKFRCWLSKKLTDSNPDIDLDVFVSYIQGILEDDTSREEKIESLNDLLPSVVEVDTSEFCDCIMKHWDETAGSQVKEETVSVDDKLAEIMEKQKLSVQTKRERTVEEKAQKAAILAQYATVSDGDADLHDDDDKHDYSGANSMLAITKNMNTDTVNQRQKEVRDKLKEDSDRKKEKDKVDREKQKQAKVDRKEKEKQRTQKGERRR